LYRNVEKSGLKSKKINSAFTFFFALLKLKIWQYKALESFLVTAQQLSSSFKPIWFDKWVFCFKLPVRIKLKSVI